MKTDGKIILSMTLKELGYEPHWFDGSRLIFRKIQGDTDITLETDTKTRKVRKWTNDFIKKVEIIPEAIEVILMVNEASKPETELRALKLDIFLSH